MAERNWFTFGGYDSRDFGIYISGSGTFDAPERDYETAIVPGRNGALLMTMSRIDNIELEYPAYIYSDFSDRIAAMRSAFMGLEGYQRLTDSYHPDEYRLAYFEGDVSVKTTKKLDAGSFTLTFICKPQRYLVDGEESVEIGQWGETTTVQGDVVTFDAEEWTGIKSLAVDIEPVQSGTGDPSPSNVRPITGHDSVNVMRARKNMLHNSLSTTTKQGLTYTVNSDGSVTVTGTATANSYVAIPINRTFDENVILSGSPSMTGIYGQIVTSGGNISDTGSGATVVAGATITEYRCRINNGVNPNGATFYPMLRLASDTDATFEPYTGTTYPVSFSSAGTVYGGTVDVMSGVLTVDKFFKSFDGTEAGWTKTGNISQNTNRYYITWENMGVVGGVSAPAQAICSHLTYLSGNVGQFGTFNSSSTNFAVKDGDGTQFANDINTFKSWLAAQNTAETPLQFCVELATPQTYQLTPTQVETLLGENNVWADTGDVTVEYGQDPTCIVNPTYQTALPVIRVYGYGTLTVGSETITIASHANAYIDIDCEIMDCYCGAVNCNSLVSFSSHEFPKLPAGATHIAYSGNITKVEVTPNWWRA